MSDDVKHIQTSGINFVIVLSVDFYSKISFCKAYV